MWSDRNSAWCFGKLGGSGVRDCGGDDKGIPQARSREGELLAMASSGSRSILGHNRFQDRGRIRCACRRCNLDGRYRVLAHETVSYSILSGRRKRFLAKVSARRDSCRHRSINAQAYLTSSNRLKCIPLASRRCRLRAFTGTEECPVPVCIEALAISDRGRTGHDGNIVWLGCSKRSHPSVSTPMNESQVEQNIFRVKMRQTSPA